jgi:hypothetical protein
MKKSAALALVLLIVAGTAFAEDGLTVSGEIKTALEVITVGDNDATVGFDTDGDGQPGRAQVGFVFTKGDFQAKWMLRSANLGDDGLSAVIPYAFGTAGFLDSQVVVSVGRIDGTPWASGGVTDVSVGSGAGARFEFKPAFLEGLDLGFYLPATFGSDPSGAATALATVGVADYFSELVFGVAYAAADLVDVRLGFQLDGDGDEAANAQAGATFIWGLGLEFLKPVAPGLSVWLDGQIRGIGGDTKVYYTEGHGNTDDAGYTTNNAIKIGYTDGKLSAYVSADFETWKDQGTILGVFPDISYQVTPWLKPGVYAELYFTSYEDVVKTPYKAATGEDPAGFDKAYVKLYAALDLGNGLTITPAFLLTNHSAYGRFGKANPNAAVTSGTAVDEARLDTELEISLVYSF